MCSVSEQLSREVFESLPNIENCRLKLAKLFSSQRYETHTLTKLEKSQMQLSHYHLLQPFCYQALNQSRESEKEIKIKLFQA